MQTWFFSQGHVCVSRLDSGRSSVERSPTVPIVRTQSIIQLDCLGGCLILSPKDNGKGKLSVIGINTHGKFWKRSYQTQGAVAQTFRGVLTVLRKIQRTAFASEGWGCIHPYYIPKLFLAAETLTK